jgi:magnesium chelatase family protein
LSHCKSLSNEFGVLYSRALNGVDAPEVVVEMHLANGLTSFTIVGLPEAEVKEYKDRVHAVFRLINSSSQHLCTTVNLAQQD